MSKTEDPRNRLNNGIQIDIKQCVLEAMSLGLIFMKMYVSINMDVGLQNNVCLHKERRYMRSAQSNIASSNYLKLHLKTSMSDN